MSTNNKKIFLAISALAIVFAGVWLIGGKNTVTNSGTYEDAGQHNFAGVDVKFNPLLFYPAISEFPAVKTAEVQNARALIVPHHDLASRLTAAAMAKIASDKIKTIYIVGPNHENKGNGQVITGLVKWQTELGEVKAEQAIVNKLLAQGLAAADPDRLATEHTINTLIPFIKTYFPKAKVAPIILYHDSDKELAGKLAKFLADNAGDDSLIIGSIDFSHYLPTFKAKENDKLTEQAIKAYDYEKIFSFNDDFIDSPISLATVMKASKLAGAEKLEIINHANSAEMIGAESVLSSTSYFTVLFNFY